MTSEHGTIRRVNNETHGTESNAKGTRNNDEIDCEFAVSW